MNNNPHASIILASTSVYRRRLLERLEIPFTCVAPRTDEQPRDGESPRDLSLRLSAEKALAVSASHPDKLVIGSDQVAAVDDRLLGKPGDEATARQQLACCNGRVAHFYTSVCVARGGVVLDSVCVPTDVGFRALAVDEINSYVAREQPYDCAGSFRWEGLGIALFEFLRSEDPTALEGLPLIATRRMLEDSNINILITAT